MSPIVKSQIVKTIETILQKRNAGERLYLVLGGYVNANENKRGRTFYTHDNVYIMDQEICDKECPFKERYIQRDISHTFLLRGIAKKLANAFDCILFDWSVYKFLTSEDKESLFSIYSSLLKTGGSFYIDDPKQAYGVVTMEYIAEKRKTDPLMPVENIANAYRQEIGQRNYNRLITILSTNGFTKFTFIQNPNEITDTIVKQIYTEGIEESNRLPVLFAEKGTSGGKRKTRKSKKSRNNKNKFIRTK